MFVVYLKSNLGKPYYVGEGSAERPFQSFHFRRVSEGHNCVVILHTSEDKTAVRLQEQGIISWLGIENLVNIQPFDKAGTKQNWTKMGPPKGHKESKETRHRKSRSHTGKRWWTNGVEHTQAKQCPGEGWRLGRLPNKKKK